MIMRFASAAFALCACGHEEAKPAPASQPAVPSPITAPADAAAKPIDVTARQLLSDYNANEVRADGEYKGKLLRVSGRVDDIGKDVLGDPYAELSQTAAFGVQCMFSDARAVAGLNKGQVISVRCRGDGKLGNVIVRDCAIDTEIPSDPNAFIPDPGQAIRVLGDDKAAKEAGVAVRNHCRGQKVNDDPLGDLWNTATLAARRSGENFVVSVTFDDRRKAVHRGRSPRIEVNTKLTKIRALNEDAKALCDL